MCVKANDENLTKQTKKIEEESHIVLLHSKNPTMNIKVSLLLSRVDRVHWPLLRALKLLTGANLRYQTYLVKLNYPVILFHRRSTTLSLETYPLCEYKGLILIFSFYIINSMTFPLIKSLTFPTDLHLFCVLQIYI